MLYAPSPEKFSFIQDGWGGGGGWEEWTWPPLSKFSGSVPAGYIFTQQHLLRMIKLKLRQTLGAQELFLRSEHLSCYKYQHYLSLLEEQPQLTIGSGFCVYHRVMEHARSFESTKEA